MSDAELRKILEQVKTIAVIGAKDDPPGQAVDGVGRYLIQAGYEVIPVHPVRQKVWGLTCYKELAEIPVPVHVVNVFRAPEYCAQHAREALALVPRPRLFWMQLGIKSPEAASLLAGNGLPYVENVCIMVEHRRLLW